MALNVRLRREATFATFFRGVNTEAVSSLRALAQVEPDQLLGGAQVYLWGAASTGKSHLLQAICHEFSCQGMNAVYLPLRVFGNSDVEVLNDLGELALVCIDDLDAVIDKSCWQMALFNLINDSRQAGHALVFASRQNPVYLAAEFPDLASRLVWGLVFRLNALDDESKLAALRSHANHRGLIISDEVGRYLLNNLPRDLVLLLEVLDRLDEVSLAAQRRLTVPFIKSVLLG